MALQVGGAEGMWRERLDRFLSSGLTVQAFCRQAGIAESNSYSWKRRLGVNATPATKRLRAEPWFVPVSVSPVISTREVRIALPGGAVVHVPIEADERVLKAVIEAATIAAASCVGQAGAGC